MAAANHVNINEDVAPEVPFTAAQKRELEEQDYRAWRGVVGILLGVAGAGVLMMAITVLISTQTL